MSGSILGNTPAAAGVSTHFHAGKFPPREVHRPASKTHVHFMKRVGKSYLRAEAVNFSALLGSLRFLLGLQPPLLALLQVQQATESPRCHNPQPILRTKAHLSWICINVRLKTTSK